MKILKRGSLPEDEEHTAKCSHCGTEIQFYRKEASIESTCRNETYLKIACPVCHRMIWVEIP